MPTYQELKAQAEALLAQAEEMRKKERGAVIAELKSKIAEWGITSAELALGGASRSGKRATVAAKYIDKATGETWSGRGQAPKWLQAHLNAGKKREDFLIR